MQETRVGSLSQEDPLEKVMATHYSILAWRTPWTEKPGGLQSMWLHRVEHNRVTNTLVFQWSRLHAPDAGGPGLLPGLGTRSHLPVLKISHAATKTWHSHINTKQKTKPLYSKEVPFTALLPVEGGFRKKITFELSLAVVEAQEVGVVKRKLNFPSRTNRVFRGKILLKLYRIESASIPVVIEYFEPKKYFFNPDLL